MNQFAKRRFCLGILLFLIEAGLFFIISGIFGIENKMIIMFSIIYFLILYNYNHYSFSPCLIWQEIIEMIRAHVLYFCIAFAISVYLKSGLVFKSVIVTPIMFCLTIIIDRRIRKLFNSYCAMQVLILGSGKNIANMENIIRQNGFLFMHPVGYVDLSLLNQKTVENGQSVSEKIVPLEDMMQILDKYVIEEVLIVDDNLSSEQLNDVTSKLHNRIPVIKYKPRVAFIQPYNTKVVDYDGNLFVSVTDAKKRYVDIVIKKVIDILAGTAGCLLLIPMSLIIKAANLINGDKNSIFFTQERIGKNGQTIKIYKYRSMVPDAEQILEKLMSENPKIKQEYLINKKLDPDPRVTPVGRFLRKTSLDEMPQFINVIKGEMSLIGPRPYLPREKEDMGTSYATIIKSKPGLTGMWQANGRSELSFEERCKLDVYYYDNWSIWLDLIIIVKTIKAVIGQDGAK